MQKNIPHQLKSYYRSEHKSIHLSTKAKLKKFQICKNLITLKFKTEHFMNYHDDSPNIGVVIHSKTLAQKKEEREQELGSVSKMPASTS